jgi:hypothetical protein
LQSPPVSLAQVAYNPIALEFKEACSHHAFKSLVENQATHRLGAAKLSLNIPMVVTPNG